MAARPGEELVATLFGDVHYFYGPPTNNPPHHRFDKGSYVYLFEDPNQGRARLEIANQPGTEDQDAFDGYLDNVHLQYTYKHTCLVTLIVGQVNNQEEWHLPTYDPHNQAKYHYKLHSLDLYFWTHQDALEFVNGIRRVLPHTQCEVLDEPGPPPRQPTEASSLVQKLEKVAISDSSPAQQANPGVPSFPGPPVSAVDGDLPPPPPPPAAFSPIPYNPAAPAAPEQLRHREKTPPPEDGVANPLHQTLAYDAATPFSPGLPPGPSHLSPLSPGIPPPNLQHPPGAPTFPGPPVASPGFAPQGFGSLGGVGAPPHPGITRSVTMPAVGTPLSSPGLVSPYGGVGTFPGQPQVYNPAAVAAVSQTPTPPAVGGIGASPGVGVQGPQTAQAGLPQQNEYAVHQQFYVPEEEYRPKKEVRGKLEENAGRLERGVSGMLKKFEKKFG
ncbi:hypothetical protein QC762_106370 [Podospora pseudocomata]|uniref:RNA recognition motif-containing protein n=3 Tax=Podospora TaxID=5144 RepID=A0A090C8V6_PODAN|nr:hypothetical protein QC762_106370 [Podospora pseudocomata]CDP22976.1 Putative protein of unknown function [Podospora anserina S mat+]